MSLSARNVGIEYGDTLALRDITLDVEAGEVLAIIGPSGAGKTTLLELFGLFRPPKTGVLTIDGEDVWSISERERLAARRRVTMVFQEAALFDASVRRNVAYGLKVRDPWTRRVRTELGHLLGRNGTYSEVEDVLELVEMADAVNRDVSSLSGGEAQRVAFARAVAPDPDVLLLDEPTSDLDPRNTALIEAAIEAAAEREIAVVIATHDMHQAERIADRVAVLLGGRLLEVGETETMFTQPTEERTRLFIEGELVY